MATALKWIHKGSGNVIDGMVPVIYSDPCWQYQSSGGRGAAENHYRTMSLDQLAALPVDHLAPSTAILFMWATWPLLWEALTLGQRWGFAYKTCAFNWVKLTSKGDPATGMGSYTRANSEPCLLFTRGKAAQLIKSHSVKQIIRAPDAQDFATEDVLSVPGAHSEKPQEVRDRIIELVGPEVPTLEMFARTRDPRFEVWGNEVDETVKLEQREVPTLPWSAP